jgi:signal-transduction protein with cAMP-binding, CBS, and nucleotidyltransferase domain
MEANESGKKAWASRTKNPAANSGLTGSLDVSVSKFLRGHVLFKDINDERFMEKLASSLQIRIYAEKDVIIKKGEVGRAMFFILKGQVAIVSEDGIYIFCL